MTREAASMAVSEMEAFAQALSLAHNAMHQGNVEEAHQIIHRAMGIEDGAINPNGPKFYRDFDRAFNNACRKQNVRACYVIFDQDNPLDPRSVRVLTGGDVDALGILKPVMAAGMHAVAVREGGC